MPSSSRFAKHCDLHSVPTRRSSDLLRMPALLLGGGQQIDRERRVVVAEEVEVARVRVVGLVRDRPHPRDEQELVVLEELLDTAAHEDRKSTRLNSSHLVISYAVFFSIRQALRSTLCPYTTLFRSASHASAPARRRAADRSRAPRSSGRRSRSSPRSRSRPRAGSAASARRAGTGGARRTARHRGARRSEEHTSELQSPCNLVCRLLLDSPSTAIYTLSLHDALPICFACQRSCSAAGSRSIASAA